MNRMPQIHKYTKQSQRAGFTILCAFVPSWQKKYPTIFFLIPLFLFSCSKHKANQFHPFVYTSTPFIELVKVTPTNAHQLSDSIVFTIKYSDKDGDIGFENADSMSLFLTDKRFPLTFTYHIPPLTPAGSNIIITGQLPVILSHTILKDNNSASETATFDIQLKDRANNYSNTITTPAITILP